MIEWGEGRALAVSLPDEAEARIRAEVEATRFPAPQPFGCGLGFPRTTHIVTARR